MNHTTPAFPVRVALVVVGAALGLSSVSCLTSTTSPRSAGSVAPLSVEAVRFDPSRALGSSQSFFRAVDVERQRDDLVVQIVTRGPASASDARYDPFTPGGWSFQLFLDTDQQPTGYLDGYDFLTRDCEPDLNGHELRIRHTLADADTDTSPDGWGAATGVVPLHGGESLLAFRIPLADLGGDDGSVAYRLEVYRTVSCPECPGGISHEYLFHLVGESGASRALVMRHDPRAARAGNFARAMTVAVTR